MNNKVILVVDDEQTYLDTITDAFDKSDFEIIQALNGEMGLLVAHQFNPDIIITDWEMPIMNGIEMMTRLKSDERTKDTPVIICTGLMISSQNLATALKAGAIDFVRKPLEPIELIARVSSAIAHAESLKRIKAQNEELNSLNNTKNKLFSIIGHDLRGPFTGILGFLELLGEQLIEMDKESIQEFIKLMNDSVKQSLSLLENLLIWAKSQTGQISFKPEIMKLTDIIQRNLVFLQATANLKNIRIDYHSREDFLVKADANMLDTVLRNLISNAIKFTNKGGLIKIEATSASPMLVISIADNGIGMPASELPGLFKIEKNKSRPGTANETGTGLGLILCKEFVTRHGGEIWAESTPNVGSTFYFTLPM
jgi:two-component system, sensor histidine kinase and response regulator